MTSKLLPLFTPLVRRHFHSLASLTQKFPPGMQEYYITAAEQQLSNILVTTPCVKHNNSHYGNNYADSYVTEVIFRFNRKNINILLQCIL